MLKFDKLSPYFDATQNQHSTSALSQTATTHDETKFFECTHHATKRNLVAGKRCRRDRRFRPRIEGPVRFPFLISDQLLMRFFFRQRTSSEFRVHHEINDRESVQSYAKAAKIGQDAFRAKFWSAWDMSM